MTLGHTTVLLIAIELIWLDLFHSARLLIAPVERVLGVVLDHQLGLVFGFGDCLFYLFLSD